MLPVATVLGQYKLLITTIKPRGSMKVLTHRTRSSLAALPMSRNVTDVLPFETI